MKQGQLTVSVVSLKGKGGGTTGNLEKIISYTEHAAQKGCDLVLFPELAFCGGTSEIGMAVFDLAQPADGRWIQALRRLAKRCGIFIGAGFPLQSRVLGRVYSGYAMAAPDGSLRRLLCRQCFDGEDQLYFCSGQKCGAVTADRAAGTIGYALGAEITDDAYVEDLKARKPRLILAAAAEGRRDVCALARRTNSYVVFSATNGGCVCAPDGKPLAEHIGDTEFSVTLPY